MNRFPRLRQATLVTLLGLSLFTLVAGMARLSAPFPRWVELHARVAEAGGWTPGSVTVRAGQPVRFRLTADDMEHGFAIGQVDRPALTLAPGRTVETDVTFDRPGKYTFYCTTWCGAGHWRMRGTIQVTGHPEEEPAPSVPLYVQLGLDIDIPHPARVVPEVRPSALRGASLGVTLPPEFLTREFYRSHRPDDAWQALRDLPAMDQFTDPQVWDLLAFAWHSATTPAALKTGQRLYAENCATCHGTTGAGDGVMADLLGNQSGSQPHASFASNTLTPTAFTNAGTMLGASPALLHGKVIRGGMGTGMPYWGPIFTDEQTWAVIDYLWSFPFEYQEMP